MCLPDNLLEAGGEAQRAMARPISFKLMKLVRDCPPAVLPLSLMCCNFGAMWNAAATNLEALKALQPGLARLADVTNAMAVALQVFFIMRCCGDRRAGAG